MGPLTLPCRLRRQGFFLMGQKKMITYSIEIYTKFNSVCYYTDAQKFNETHGQRVRIIRSCFAIETDG